MPEQALSRAVTPAAPPEKLLRQGIRALALPPAPTFEKSCLAYLRLLMDWNRVYSLTAARSLEELILRHVLDALALLPYLHGQNCLDLGSGAGFPGLVLALAQPRRRWVLLDASLKKSRFLRQVCLELSLPQVTVAHCRAETYSPRHSFDIVTLRALGGKPLSLVRLAAPLCAPNGRILLCRGKAPTVAETTALKQQGHLPRRHVLEVPGARHRCLLELEVGAGAPPRQAQA